MKKLTKKEIIESQNLKKSEYLKNAAKILRGEADLIEQGHIESFELKEGIYCKEFIIKEVGFTKYQSMNRTEYL
jgi:hypothetical protein